MIDRSTVWIPKPAVMKAIPVAAMHDFLTRRGWLQKPSSQPGLRYYEHPERKFGEGRLVSCFIPASDQFPDYPLRVLDFIENQAVNWGMDAHAVLSELQGGPVAEETRTSVPA
jgi:hypothetical protein